MPVFRIKKSFCILNFFKVLLIKNLPGYPNPSYEDIPPPYEDTDKSERNVPTRNDRAQEILRPVSGLA